MVSMFVSFWGEDPNFKTWVNIAEIESVSVCKCGMPPRPFPYDPNEATITLRSGRVHKTDDGDGFVRDLEALTVGAK